MKHKELLEKLTIKEKVAFLSGKNVWQTWNFPHLNIPSIFLADGPTGLRKQSGAADHLGLNASEPATCFPTAATVANSWNPELGEEIGDAMAKEAVAYNVHVVLGPGLNIKRSPLCGRNFEYFSEDPYLSGKLAAGYIRGLQKGGVSACPKHFAVNSQELRRMASNSIIDERAMREMYLTGFEIAVKESSPKTIMTSYNEINGTYANENKHLLMDILRGEWGFDGVVVTDWGGSNEHVLGVKNGSTLEMPYPGLGSARELLKAIKDGRLTEQDIDNRVDELLELVLSSKHTDGMGDFDRDAHHMIAQKAAEESIVLLKNKDNILPLKESTKVAVIGDFAKTPRYQGAGSSMVNPTKLDSTLDYINDCGLTFMGYEQGYQRSGEINNTLIKNAAELAKGVEVVLLYIGLDELSESEGLDRTHMKIPQNQIALLEALSEVNPNIITIISAGAPIEMPWIGQCKALLHGYLLGQAGGVAMLNVITGKINPSGKLTETYPHKLEDTPSYKYFPGKGRNAEYRESIFVGYRYYETLDRPVLLPFGYGLSYTKFEYKDITIKENEVSFTVKNIGTVFGAEIPQMYIKLSKTDIFRSAMELKGFSKVYLEPNEKKQVTIKLDEYTFRYFNIKTNRFETEGGKYEILIGSNICDIRLSETVLIKTTTTELPYACSVLPSYFSGNILDIPEEEFLELLDDKIIHGDRNGQLTVNDPISQIQYAKSGLARLAFKIMSNKMKRSERKGKPNLNLLFVYNMPFRALAKMTNGAVDGEMIKGILTLVNGSFFKGLRQIIGSFFRNKKENKNYWKE